MDKNKHMDLDARYQIEHGLDKKLSFKAIATLIGKDCTTISKEVRGHLLTKRIGYTGAAFNDCTNRKTCKKYYQCLDCIRGKRALCSSCGRCLSHCEDYVKESCPKLDKPPYVCNGCPIRSRCSLEKKFYEAIPAQKTYVYVRSEARTGINANEEQIKQLDNLISPLIKNGQSIHHICTNNPDVATVCEKTLYRYVNYGLFSAKNIDMPRKVCFHPRKSKPQEPKVDKSCRIGRTYEDFKAFMEQNPLLPVVELDSVEGTRGGAVLLTIHFVTHKFQLAFRRDANNSKSVTDIFLWLRKELGRDLYRKLFQVLLCDNGPEFSNPKALEFDEEGNRLSYVFYCHAQAPQEKGACENNHEMIRRIIPKGKDITPYTQEQVLLMMSHINSYARPDLGDKTPFELFEFCYGKSVMKKLNIKRIKPNDVVLKPSLLNPPSNKKE